MDRFLDCLCDDNLSALIINGTANDIQLHEAWVMILAEYHEIKGDTIEGMEEYRLSRDISRLQNHLFLVQNCVDFLFVRWSESVVKSLKMMGYAFNPNTFNPDEYYTLLRSVVNKARGKYIQIQQLIKQLAKCQAETVHEKPKRKHFEGLLIEIEEMQHVAYTMEGITVSKFLSLEEKLWHQVELMEAKKGKA